MMRTLAIVLVLATLSGTWAALSGFRARAGSLLRMMSGDSRLPLIAGNWKLNPTDVTTAVALAKEAVELTKSVDPKKAEVLVCPPFVFLSEVAKITAGTNVKLGAQNCFYELKGAFTGATSAPMLKSLGVQYCLVGHSERRKIFKEEDGDINHVVEKLQAHDITPILCIGETKEEYELGLNTEICNMQLSKDLKGLTDEQVSKLVIAYEPVWAIGTGLSATPAIAQSVHNSIRTWLRVHHGAEVAKKVRIQYGGSVTPETVDDLMKCPDIDGALVGGASLVAKSFARIAGFN